LIALAVLSSGSEYETEPISSDFFSSPMEVKADTSGDFIIFVGNGIIFNCLWGSSLINRKFDPS